MGLVERRNLVLTAVAVLTVVSLGALAWQWYAGPPAVADGRAATLGGITTEIRQAAWVDFDHGHVMDGQGGFMMPDQMMPGAPKSDEVRLGVTLTLANTDGQAHGFSLVEEFSLVGGTVAEPSPPAADTIGGLSRLGPGAAVDGTIYFDVPVPSEQDPPLYLQWRREGEAVRILVPLTEDAPKHQHG